MNNSGVERSGSRVREDPPPVAVCGRSFSVRDLEVIRRIIADDSAPCRAEIARRVCRDLDWFDEAGRLKAMSCRVALLRLEERGLLRLPAPRNGNGNGKPYSPSLELSSPSGNHTRFDWNKP